MTTGEGPSPWPRRLFWLLLPGYLAYLGLALAVAMTPRSFVTQEPDGLEGVPLIMGILIAPVVIVLLIGLRSRRWQRAATICVLIMFGLIAASALSSLLPG